MSVLGLICDHSLDCTVLLDELVRTRRPDVPDPLGKVCTQEESEIDEARPREL